MHGTIIAVDSRYCSRLSLRFTATWLEKQYRYNCYFLEPLTTRASRSLIRFTVNSGNFIFFGVINAEVIGRCEFVTRIVELVNGDLPMSDPVMDFNESQLCPRRVRV